MNYGLYLSAAGALTNLYRQDVISNNLANANTIGFKPDSVVLTGRLPERLENGGGDDPQWLLEQLGGGTLVHPTMTQFRQGSLMSTANGTDVAISGDGFFVLRDASVSGGADSLRFTRDGRFAMNDRGELISASSGLAVLDEHDRPIHLDRGADLHIDSDGTIRQDNAVVARLQITHVRDTMTLEKLGDNVLRFKAGSGGTRQPSEALVKQGFVEQSAVDPVLAMKELMDVSRAISANTTMMQYQDRTLEQLIGTVGRVA